MQQEGDENRDRADRNPIRRKFGKAFTQLHDGHPKNHAEAAEKNRFVIIDELRKIGADVENKKERQKRDQAGQGANLGQGKSNLRQKEAKKNDRDADRDDRHGNMQLFDQKGGSASTRTLALGPLDPIEHRLKQVLKAVAPPFTHRDLLGRPLFFPVVISS